MEKIGSDNSLPKINYIALGMPLHLKSRMYQNKKQELRQGFLVAGFTYYYLLP